MKTTKKSSPATITLDLADIVSTTTLAKLYYLCKKRKLSFPEGVLFLLQEASEPSDRRTCKGENRKGSLRTAKNASRKGKAS